MSWPIAANIGTEGIFDGLDGSFSIKIRLMETDTDVRRWHQRMPLLGCCCLIPTCLLKQTF